jgi:plasmid stability protein
MKTMTIRGLPEEVHEGLKESARANRRSLNQEVVESLVQIAGRTERTRHVEALLAAADEIYSKIETPLTPQEIRDGIDEGRD